MKTFLILILYASSIYGQGVIKGLVIDSLSMEQLKGAEIILTGTNFSTVSNINGEFYISGMPAGDYILQTSYLGYREKKILVTVKPEKALTLNIKLLPVITAGNKTLLTDQSKSQAEKINREISSNIVKNVVAGKKLQDMPDENIPVALSRLPGVSIIYNSLPVPFPVINGGSGIGGISPGPNLPSIPLGDFTLPDDPAARILIRGLDARYYNVTVDGIRIPPASAIDKNIDLNNLPERDFQNIEVHKTVTSDEDADATAGTINMATEKAPYKRMIKIEALGNYNRLDKSGSQYNFNGTYGERFFDDALGVRADAHIERKIMSNEAQNSLYDFQYLNSSYTNAVRDRYGANILLDYTTPDGGSIKFHNIFNKTNTDNFKSEAESSPLYTGMFNFSDNKTEQEIFLSSLGGNNHLFGFDVDWNAAFSESRDNHPYNYSLSFNESQDIFTGKLLGNYALDYASDIPTKNYSKEKTVSLDIHRKYALSNEITGELKLGGKYRINSRSYFENSHMETANSQIGLSYFQDNPSGERTGLGNFLIPTINEDSLRSWRRSTISEYDTSNGPDINSYDMSQSVSAAYIMHTFNFRGAAIFIAGLRIENEHNNYYGYYFPNTFGMTGDENMIFNLVALNNDLPEKTPTSHYDNTTVLPNFQMILKPTGFMNLRLAAYKTLIRPPSAARIPKYFAMSVDYPAPYYLSYLNIGNPDLKNANVWNYEFQAQFYGNDIGQFSIDVFYKDIEGMVQSTNGIQISDSTAVKSLGIDWRSYVGRFPFTFPSGINSLFNFFSYYNSPKPTRIWGFEVDHQANFRYLHGLLKNIVLNYNFTFLRSESWTTDQSGIITTTAIAGKHTTETTQSVLVNRSEKLSDMPDFFANVNLGYDIDGFSFRISYFYQDEYQMYDIPTGIYVPSSKITQVKKNSFSRLDITARQQIGNISVILNLNNITNSEEEALIKNPPESFQSDSNWETAQAYRYGMNIDFGVGINF